METFPGPLTATEVADSFLAIFASEGIQISRVPQLVSALSAPALRTLQCYWVDAQLRGLPAVAQGCEWAQQRAVAASATRVIIANLRIKNPLLDSEQFF